MGKQLYPLGLLQAVLAPSAHAGSTAAPASPVTCAEAVGAAAGVPRMAAEGLQWGAARSASDCFALDQRCGSGMSLSRCEHGQGASSGQQRADLAG